MSTDEVNVAEIAGKLTKAQRALTATIYFGFGVGDYFRPDEGESHTVYAALHRIGILGRDRVSDMPTVYWLTALGLRVRQYLLEHKS